MPYYYCYYRSRSIHVMWHTQDRLVSVSLLLFKFYMVSLSMWKAGEGGYWIEDESSAFFSHYYYPSVLRSSPPALFVSRFHLPSVHPPPISPTFNVMKRSAKQSAVPIVQINWPLFQCCSLVSWEKIGFKTAVFINNCLAVCCTFNSPATCSQCVNFFHEFRIFWYRDLHFFSP